MFAAVGFYCLSMAHAHDHHGGHDYHDPGGHHFVVLRKMAPVALLLLGLILTTIGAFIASNAVIISNDQAQRLSETDWDHNQALKDSLLDQSRSAQCGLRFIFVGTILQIVGTV